MDNVADFAEEFGRRARNGEKPIISVSKKYLEAFLGELKRQGIEFAKECLDAITDPHLRRIIEAIFFSTLAGAATGAAIGGVVGGPGGAQVGALVGAGAGFAIGCIAVTITAIQRNGPDGPEVVIGVK